jgi:putative DNA primase/helicase
MNRNLAAALVYAGRNWPVFPISVKKVPLTLHGLLDATTDETTTRAWWSRWPDALVAIATGERSGIVALDIDLSEKVSGFDSLEEIGAPFHPNTLTAHTPRGGCHVLFKHPGHFVKTVASKLGPGLDIRGDGGSLILPPGPGRFWDPHLGLNTPLAPMPDWMVIAEPERRQEPRPAPRSAAPMSRYSEVALDNAVRMIITAPAGSQRDTLNAQCYGIGGLVAGGALPADLALQSLQWAAERMPAHDARRPWHSGRLRMLVREAFLDGQAHPRGAP